MKTKTGRVGFLALELVFVGIIVLISFAEVDFELWMFIPLGLATFRMARTLSFNEIAEPIRAPFTYIIPDSCGAGENVHPRGDKGGLRYAIGSLLACPICTGTWSALVLFIFWVFVPTIGKPLVYTLAIAGISELLHYSACLLEWNSRSARVLSGKISPDKR